MRVIPRGCVARFDSGPEGTGIRASVRFRPLALLERQAAARFDSALQNPGESVGSIPARSTYRIQRKGFHVFVLLTPTGDRITSGTTYEAVARFKESDPRYASCPIRHQCDQCHRGYRLDRDPADHSRAFANSEVVETCEAGVPCGWHACHNAPIDGVCAQDGWGSMA